MYNLIKKNVSLENKARVQIFCSAIGKFPLSYKKRKKNTEIRKLESMVSLFLKTKQKER